MEQVDVLYVQNGKRGYVYYPQTPAARRHFSHFMVDHDGGYPFLEDKPDLLWLECVGLTHAPKEPE